MADQAFVAGGALGGQGGDQGESSPAALKTTLVGILQEGENVNQYVTCTFMPLLLFQIL